MAQVSNQLPNAKYKWNSTAEQDAVTTQPQPTDSQDRKDSWMGKVGYPGVEVLEDHSSQRALAS